MLLREVPVQHEHGDVWIEVPQDKLPALAHIGRRIWGQVAVLDEADLPRHPRSCPLPSMDPTGGDGL